MSAVGKLKEVFSSPRVLLAVVILVLFLIAIHWNPFAQGVVIKAVVRNSSASIAGFEGPTSATRPMALEKILSVNGKPVTSVDDYSRLTADLPANKTVQITTDKATYRLLTRPILQITDLGNETQVIQETILVNKTVNGTMMPVETIINKTVTVPVTERKIVGVEPLGLTVATAPETNLRKGLDLQGGTRVLLQPEEAVTDDVFATMIESMKQRLNVYGVSDIVVVPVTDLEGSKYILVELAGATESQARDLLAKQGKFEAKVGNATVFKGGNDITYVCRTAECSGIDPNRGCGPVGEGAYGCAYYFQITLSEEAAKLHASITKDLEVIGTPPEDYLSQNLTLFLDDSLVRELRIGADLRGSETTNIQISGFGTGTTEQQAVLNSQEDMKTLQTVLITGKLPAKIKIVRVDTISPKLGASFTTNALFMAGMAVLAVVIILIIRYRTPMLAVPIVLTSVAEVLLTLGSYALFGWSLDLAAIAGIIVAVGTGVNDQIVITDETLRKDVQHGGSWAERIKRAFFIIMAAYFTALVSMVPLLFAGAGLLRGFAITTIVGITFGVFITRPAFGKLVEVLVAK